MTFISITLNETTSLLDGLLHFNYTLPLEVQAFPYRSQTLLKTSQAIPSLVRPHLECAMQACSPNLVSDADCLGQIQWLATSLLKGFRRLSYDEQLRWLGQQGTTVLSNGHLCTRSVQQWLLAPDSPCSLQWQADGHLKATPRRIVLMPIRRWLHLCNFFC